MSHQEEAKVIHTTGRNNCGGRCVIHAHVRDGRIEKLTTDTAAEAGCGAPLTACVRGNELSQDLSWRGTGCDIL